jgi:hypothetical protein
LGQAAEEFESIPGPACQILSLDGENGIHIGQVNPPDQSELTNSHFAVVFWINNQHPSPGWGMVFPLCTSGVGLAAELTHAIFVPYLLVWNSELFV